MRSKSKQWNVLRGTKRKESSEQIASVHWAYLQHKLVSHHSPNELMRFLSDGQKIHQVKMGFKKGFPDLMILMPSKGFGALFIEFKSRQGRLTAEQEFWQIWLNSNGYKAVVCRSFEEAKKEIEAYLNP